MVKAVIGYGIGLAVLGIVLSYAVRVYLRVRRDKVLKLARRDSGRLELSISSRYEHTFLGTPVQPARSSATGRPRHASPYDQASDRVDA